MLGRHKSIFTAVAFKGNLSNAINITCENRVVYHSLREGIARHKTNAYNVRMLIYILDGTEEVKSMLEQQKTIVNVVRVCTFRVKYDRKGIDKTIMTTSSR